MTAEQKRKQFLEKISAVVIDLGFEDKFAEAATKEFEGMYDKVQCDWTDEAEVKRTLDLTLHMAVSKVLWESIKELWPKDDEQWPSKGESR